MRVKIPVFHAKKLKTINNFKPIPGWYHSVHLGLFAKQALWSPLVSRKMVTKASLNTWFRASELAHLVPVFEGL